MHYLNETIKHSIEQFLLFFLKGPDVLRRDEVHMPSDATLILTYLSSTNFLSFFIFFKE